MTDWIGVDVPKLIRAANSRVVTMGWQLAIPVPRDPEAEARDVLSKEAADSPAFTHIVEYLNHARSLGLDVAKPTVLRRAIEAGNTAYAEELSRHSHQESYAPLRSGMSRKHSPLVYYMRNNDLVKIGYTTDLRKRNSAIHHSGILVVEPGGPEVETQRHQQFEELWEKGEWFRFQPPLVDHVFELRSRFEAEMGIDFEEWVRPHVDRRKLNGPRHFTGKQSGVPRLDLPVQRVGQHETLGALVNAHLGGAAVRRKPSDIKLWEKRAYFAAVAKTENGQRLYRLADIVATARKVRANDASNRHG